MESIDSDEEQAYEREGLFEAESEFESEDEGASDVSDTTVSRDTVIKTLNDLGVQVTSNLDWSDHTYKICKKANKMLGLLMRCTLAFQNSRTTRLLYLTIVRSNFSYASQLWAPQKVELI